MVQKLIEDKEQLPITLTDRQRQFCREFMGDQQMDPGAAMVAAGYSSESPTHEGRKLLRKANIQQYLRELSQDLDFPREMLPATLAENAKAIAMFDPRKAFKRDAAGNVVLLDVIDMPHGVAVCIKSMTEVRIRQGDQWIQGFKCEFYDKLKAMELIGRWLGMENRKDPLQTDLEPQPEWAGLIVEGLPAERTEDQDEPSEEQRTEQARQVRALSTFEEGDLIIEETGD